MTKAGWDAVTALAFAVAFGFGVIRAAAGFSATPRFDVVLFGFVCAINLISLGLALAELTR